MKSYCFALATLVAVGFAGGAYAEDAKPKPTAPTVMSDSEMDNVTAAGKPSNPGYGNLTAQSAGSGLNPDLPRGWGKLTNSHGPN
jgi:hypothetical protein